MRHTTVLADGTLHIENPCPMNVLEHQPLEVEYVIGQIIRVMFVTGHTMADITLLPALADYRSVVRSSALSTTIWNSVSL